MKIDVTVNGNVCVLAPDGRLDAMNAPLVKQRFEELVKNYRQFVMDLKSVDFLDSTGLGTLVACLKTVTECNGNIKVANLQDKARMVFEITRAHRIFDIFDDAGSAVDSF